MSHAAKAIQFWSLSSSMKKGADCQAAFIIGNRMVCAQQAQTTIASCRVCYQVELIGCVAMHDFTLEALLA